MPPDIDAIECASLPASALAALADLRRESGVTVTVAGGRAWVRWRPDAGLVLRRVLPIPGAELYTRRDGLWYRHGNRLPSFGLPVDGGTSVGLERAVIPAPVVPEPPGGEPTQAVAVRLVRDDRARTPRGLRCTLGEIAPWAELAPTARLASLLAAWDGERVLVLGDRLPPVAGGERFWGGRVLTPLGFRPDPDLPESALGAALGGGTDAILALTGAGVEVVPRAAFRPLTRAGLRLAGGGRTP